MLKTIAIAQSYTESTRRIITVVREIRRRRIPIMRDIPGIYGVGKTIVSA